MSKAYRVFTVSSGEVQVGAEVQTHSIDGGKVKIPAIIVGESGRGRSYGILPVHLAKEQYAMWKNGEEVHIAIAKVGETRSGKAKLFQKDETSDELAIIVFRTEIGFRGGNEHTGDRLEGADEYDLEFQPFPGNVLAKGRIAQGTAGRMGWGQQLVAVLPRGVVFRTGYSGRLYGAPAAHYYVFDGQKVLGLTWEDRLMSDEFSEAISLDTSPKELTIEAIVELAKKSKQVKISAEEGSLLIRIAAEDGENKYLIHIARIETV